MVLIRNSEIEDILDYYEMYGHLMKMYLYYDYKNNEAYLRFNDNGHALCCLNHIIGICSMTLENRKYFSDAIADIIFDNERSE